MAGYSFGRTSSYAGRPRVSAIHLSFPRRIIGRSELPFNEVLFSSLILVDHIITFSGVSIMEYHTERISKLAFGALMRRDIWPSWCAPIPSCLRSADRSQRRRFTPLQAIILFCIATPRGAGTRLRTPGMVSNCKRFPSKRPQLFPVPMFLTSCSSNHIDGNTTLWWILPALRWTYPVSDETGPISVVHNLQSLRCIQSQSWVRRRPGNASKFKWDSL